MKMPKYKITLQEVTDEILKQQYESNTDISHVFEYFPEPLHKYINNPDKHKYGYALILENDDVELLTFENTMPLIRLTRSNYICTKTIGNLVGLRYHYENTGVSIGDTIKVVDNWETSFGEGIYMCDLTMHLDSYNNKDIPKYYINPERKAMILYGENVEYITCIVSDDYPKDNEILVIPPHTMKIIDICDNQDTLDGWVNNQWDKKQANLI